MLSAEKLLHRIIKSIIAQPLDNNEVKATNALF